MVEKARLGRLDEVFTIINLQNTQLPLQIVLQLLQQFVDSP